MRTTEQTVLLAGEVQCGNHDVEVFDLCPQVVNTLTAVNVVFVRGAVTGFVHCILCQPCVEVKKRDSAL